MRIGGGRKRNSFRGRQLNNWIAGIKFIYWLAPAGGGKLNRKVAPPNKFKSLIDQTGNARVRAMTVDLDQIQMGNTVDQPSLYQLADTSKVIGVDQVDIPAIEL